MYETITYMTIKIMKYTKHFTKKKHITLPTILRESRKNIHKNKEVMFHILYKVFHSIED